MSTLKKNLNLTFLDRWSPQDYDLDWVLASIFLLLDEAVDSLDTQLHGVVLVVDFRGFGFSHARTARPARIQTIVSILQVTLYGNC